MHHPELRTYYIRDLEPVVADFLSTLAHQLKTQEALREINDSRVFEQLAQNVQARLERFEADEATSGTRRDYLRWLIARNTYIDPRGTFQTQRQVQVSLEEVYVSLRAQGAVRPSSFSLEHLFLDLRVQESSFEQLKASIGRWRGIDSLTGEFFSFPEYVKWSKSDLNVYLRHLLFPAKLTDYQPRFDAISSRRIVQASKFNNSPLTP